MIATAQPVITQLDAKALRSMDLFAPDDGTHGTLHADGRVTIYHANGVSVVKRDAENNWITLQEETSP